MTATSGTPHGDDALDSEWSADYWQLNQAVIDATMLPRPADQIARLERIAERLRALEAENARLREDAARLDWLERRGVEAVHFAGGGQLNPGSMSLRAAIRTTETRDDAA